MRAISGLWRWRHNPLCRRTDLSEAWVALVSLVMVLVVAPLMGIVIGAVAEHMLQQTVRDQQYARHQIAATVVKKLNRVPLDPDPRSATPRDAHSRVLARWTAPDGTTQQATVLSALRSPQPGDRFTLWTDDHGRMTTAPLDGSTATAHAVLTGIGTAALTAALVEGGRRLIVRRMLRARYARWDQAWDKAGPDWGRTGTGS
ncbi:Rv1733c family protein [Streptomyces nodosus]